MKKGLILYITKGKEDIPLQGQVDLNRLSRFLGVAAACVATTEDEMAHGWWHLITKGMHQIQCITATYDPSMDRFATQGAPLRIWG